MGQKETTLDGIGNADLGGEAKKHLLVVYWPKNSLMESVRTREPFWVVLRKPFLM
jgi:hypothetical protein